MHSVLEEAAASHVDAPDTGEMFLGLCHSEADAFSVGLDYCFLPLAAESYEKGRELRVSERELIKRHNGAVVLFLEDRMHSNAGPTDCGCEGDRLGRGGPKAEGGPRQRGAHGKFENKDIIYIF